MGVSCVHSLTIAAGKSGQQVIDGVSRQLESLGAKKCQPFSVECDTYYSVSPVTGGQTGPESGANSEPNANASTSGQSSRVLNLFKSSEYPMSCFALLDTGSSLVCDASFELIVANLSNIYSNKKMTRIEVRGQKWTLSDFFIRIGSCSLGPSLKGVLLEIEYKPSVVANHCWDLLKELSQCLCGSGVSVANQWMASRMNEMYCPLDTIQQYNHHFNQLRKTVTS